MKKLNINISDCNRLSERHLHRTESSIRIKLGDHSFLENFPIAVVNSLYERPESGEAIKG